LNWLGLPYPTAWRTAATSLRDSNADVTSIAAIPDSNGAMHLITG
jgi:hypothetical protein